MERIQRLEPRIHGSADQKAVKTPYSHSKRGPTMK